jgi:hypothetical protein
MKKGGNQQSAISGQPNNPTTQQPNNPTVFTLFVTYVLPHALSGLRFACPAFASHLNSGFPKPLASMEAASQSYQLPPVADLLRQVSGLRSQVSGLRSQVFIIHTSYFILALPFSQMRIHTCRLL